MREFLRQIVGIHVAIGGDQHLFAAAVLHKRQVAAPFVLHPDGAKVLRLCAQHHHDLGAVQRREDVRLIGSAQLVLQRDAGEKHLEALLRELVVQLVCKHAVLRPAAAAVRLLVADEDVEGFFLLRDRKNALLNFVDRFRLCLINALLVAVGVAQRGLIVLVCEDRGELRTVHRRHALMRGRVFDILNAVAAEDKRPVRLRVGVVLVEDLLIDARRLVKVVVPAEMVRAVIEVCAAVIIEPWQRLLRAAVFAGRHGFVPADLKRPAAHFAFEDRHIIYPILSFFCCAPDVCISSRPKGATRAFNCQHYTAKTQKSQPFLCKNRRTPKS